MTYGYLRVSRDTQEVASQKLGIAKKSEELGLQIGEWIEDDVIADLFARLVASIYAMTTSHSPLATPKH